MSNLLNHLIKDYVFYGLTVVDEFRELDTQSLFDPTDLFVHGKGLNV